MDGIEITEKLIRDLETVMNARNATRSSDQIMKDISYNIFSTDPNVRKKAISTPAEMHIATAYEFSIPHELRIIGQIINHFGTYINDVMETNFNLPKYLEDLKNNKDVIAESIQKMMDNQQTLVAVDSQSVESIFSVLSQRLAYLNNDVDSVSRAYDKLLKDS